MLNLIEETTDMMEDFKQSKRGTLRIGASHARSIAFYHQHLKTICMNIQYININLTVDTAPLIIEKVKTVRLILLS